MKDYHPVIISDSWPCKRALRRAAKRNHICMPLFRNGVLRADDIRRRVNANKYKGHLRVLVGTDAELKAIRARHASGRYVWGPQDFAAYCVFNPDTVWCRMHNKFPDQTTATRAGLQCDTAALFSGPLCFVKPVSPQ
jgi:hypothetical protein